MDSTLEGSFFKEDGSAKAGAGFVGSERRTARSPGVMGQGDCSYASGGVRPVLYIMKAEGNAHDLR